MPPRPRQPLIEYLGVQRRVDRELSTILARAARDAERRVIALELGRPGIGASVRRAQLLGVLRSIRELQEKLWLEDVGPLITNNLRDAQFAAQRAAEFMDDVLFEALPQEQAEILRASVRAMSESGLVTEAHRRAVELSPRVWRNADLASGAIEATIRSGIIQGLSARELARTVASFIHPSTPGGVSYAAMRLARTELNNAFHERQIAAAQRPWVNGVKWNLSGSHPKADRCDEYVKENAHDLGEGVFPKGDVPKKPHPHCLCFMTYEMMDEDDFVEQYRRVLQGGNAEEFVARYDLPETMTAAQKKAERARLRRASQQSTVTPLRAPIVRAPAPRPAPVTAVPVARTVDIVGASAARKKAIEKTLDYHQNVVGVPVRLRRVSFGNNKHLLEGVDQAPAEGIVEGRYLHGVREVRLNNDFMKQHDHDHLVHDNWLSHREGVDPVQSVLSHEIGHHLDHALTAQQRMRIFQEISDELKIAPPRHFADFDNWAALNRSKLARNVSQYGSTNARELVAEIWGEYATPGQSRPLVGRVGKLIKDMTNGSNVAAPKKPVAQAAPGARLTPDQIRQRNLAEMKARQAKRKRIGS